jgi:pimeloyl-ACP methyl ester carboxylesterase
MNEWPADLWYEWSQQVVVLCNKLGFSKVKLIGCSGGALAAINVALEKPELVDCVVADSFEGLEADPEITEQIRIGRNFAKQNAEFCSMLTAMHGEDWESVFDADTETVVAHAKTIGSFFHKPMEELKVNLILTGSAEDEMFPEGHYEKLFADICGRTRMAKSHIFEHGGHPAMMSNIVKFYSLCDEFFAKI